jgi:hypothetical protein
MDEWDAEHRFWLAERFEADRSGRAKHAELALVDGLPGAVWAPGGKPRIVFDFSIMDGLIVGIELLADTDVLDHLDWQPQPS